MTDLETPNSTRTGIDRRTLVKGAAWSIPVLAATIATPMAAASPGNASVAWTDSETGFLDLRVLGDGDVLTATALVTVPNQFTITNGPGALTTANVTIVVGRPTGGIALTAGTAHGFGVYTLNGADVSGQNSPVYETTGLFDIEFGFPITTFVGTVSPALSGNDTIAIPVEFGLSGTSDHLIALQLLGTFPVTMTVDFGDGNVVSDTTTISVPVGAGIL